ncbi:MAG: diguanylate cyclase [Candidatus Brocadia sp.]|nr:sensor domain-containing diguanylate cyclase [Candidatus Brocadia sp.]MDG6026290.1 diguanylate cyclase [Candidatus Brocadia sp.]
MELRNLIVKYPYCSIGILIAVNCSIVSIFKLNGLAFGLVVLAFCCTLQFLVYNEGHGRSNEKELNKISEDLFHRVMNTVPETVYISLFDGSVKYVSNGIEKLTGYKPEDICKTRNFILQLIHPDDQEKVSKLVQKLQGGDASKIDYRILKKDGAYIWVSDFLNPIRNEWGNVTHYNGILMNSEEKKITDKNVQSLNARVHQLNTMVNHHAVRDSLTNAYNKRYSLVILQNEFNRALAQNKALSCLLMDIDQLEAINSRYGYFIGDLILTEISKCLHKHIQSSDVVSRFGDDEFFIILPEIDAGELDRISDLLVDSVEKCFIKDDEKNISIHFRVTVGTSSLTQTTKSITDLIELASRSLYAAKMARKVHRNESV